MSTAHPRDRLPRLLGLGDATMLVVASVVGSGIFFTPAQVARLLPSSEAILLAWGVGALISLVGAFANAELGAMFPRAGGDYVYLREAFHPLAGFLVGWLSFFAIYAGTIAALSVVFAEAVAPELGLSAGGIRWLACGLVVVFSLLNLRGTRLGAALNNWTTWAKIAAILAFVILGPLLGEGHALAPDDVIPVEAEGGLALRFGRALSPILFSFLGWNASVYVASEIRDPTRNLPRSLFLGLAICAVLYLAMNGVYLYALSPVGLAAAPDAGEAAARALFGPTGGRLVSAFVLLSVLGTLNATVLVGPRIAYAMALDRQFPSAADRVHAGFQTPAVAIGVQAAVAVALVLLLETFPRALDFTVFGIVLATSADVLALFALRRRAPDRPRPYRAWGYPWLPLLYLGVHASIGVALAIASPFETGLTCGWLAAGLLLYGLFARTGRRGGAAASD